MKRILIADDHAIVRRGLKEVLTDAFPFSIIEEAEDGEDLLKKVIAEQWDIVISDISMPGRSGLEILQEIKKYNPKVPVLILSIHSEDQYAIRVFKAGASGYLTKDFAPTELINAINRIMLGKKYITPSIAEKLANTLDQDVEKQSHENLSDREFEVLKMIASGISISNIAEKLFLSSTTVSTYRSRILGKMNLRSNADLISYAIENKLI
jgi:two-component system invasion response regulator UvrY